MVLNPTYPDIHNKMGHIYYDLEDYTMAEKEFGEALNLNDRFLDAKINLGMVYFMQNRRDQARGVWQEVLSQDPQNTKAKIYLFSYFQIHEE